MEDKLKKSLAAIDRIKEEHGEEGFRKIVDDALTKVNAMNIGGPTIKEYFEMVDEYNNQFNATKTPYERGYRDAHKMLSVTSNPFELNTEDYEEWLKGYNQWNEDNFGDIIN